MAKNWNAALEVAPEQNYPEVYYPPSASFVPYRRDNSAPRPLKSLDSFNDTAAFVEAPKGTYPDTNSIQNFDSQSVQGVLPPAEQPRETPRRICGCSFLVLVLSTIIAVLSIAVIGLAAGTSVQINRANGLQSKLAARPSEIDRGCSANPNAVTASRYTSEFFGRQTYKIFCNNDAPNPPLQSLFVGNFDDCIDACASYSTYTPGNFPDKLVSRNSNLTCSAVSFIPAWTNRTNALESNAPGNCYLKPRPQSLAALTRPNSDGPAVHAAIFEDS
ncbi:hypothetical protein SAMD00023353_0801100 [Rosellinia necatrix]|uniref:Uncharacterized protein n=1 Tax=Rosellinia necatrix TaxID=77044 RepID=A0A1W2TAX9_ROSNE|nr:hypothetical protein SAMD00023353_0801100 [Rosellinia necatrix]